MRDEEDISTEEQPIDLSDSARTTVLKIQRKLKYGTRSVSLKILKEVGDNIKDVSLLLFIYFINWSDKK